MREQAVVIEAIEASWSRDTAEVPAEWSESNRAKGHCDISSFVAWEHLGGDLVLGQVHVDGDFQEYHYWNRIDGTDLDLTSSQFRRSETITEREVLSAEFLTANAPAMRPELAARIATFRERVDEYLGRRAAQPPG